VHYQEGRKVRNSRQARAIEKGSRFGRDQQEAAWQNAEVNALYALADAGVRVPRPYGCFDGVLLMDLITGADGQVAPRLNDVQLTSAQALRDHAVLMQSVVRMLCVGLVHGDLSEFNVLVDEHGPVIIDLPQAVDASANNNAQWMLARDVTRITAYYGRYAPELIGTRYAQEIWALYEKGALHPNVELTGHFVDNTPDADVETVLRVIQAAKEEEDERKQRLFNAAE
jgi:RIO kinase 1